MIYVKKSELKPETVPMDVKQELRSWQTWLNT